MEFSLTAEQRMLVDSARRMVDREIRPLLQRNDPDIVLPKAETLQLMAGVSGLGLLSARIPESAGGAGLRMLDFGLIREQLPPEVVILLQGHEATTARVYAGCSEEQKARHLDDLMAGRKIIAIGTTEPGGGSDQRGIATTVTEDGDWLVLNGRKQWITNATVCDLMIVTARMRHPDGGNRIVRVLVDRAESEFEAREIDVLGLRQTSLGEVLFDDCRVPCRNLCPDDVSTAGLLSSTWVANRPLMGLMAVSMGQTALDAAVSYARTRRQFGRLIGEFQAIQQDLADIETAVVTSRLLSYHALAAIDRGERANGLSAMAKRYAVDSCDRAIALAMRVHGAMGLSTELGLETLARDIRTLSIPDGTPGVLALIQGRELTGMDAFRR